MKSSRNGTQGRAAIAGGDRGGAFFLIPSAFLAHEIGVLGWVPREICHGKFERNERVNAHDKAGVEKPSNGTNNVAIRNRHPLTPFFTPPRSKLPRLRKHLRGASKRAAGVRS
jgi:hypothetical protein